MKKLLSLFVLATIIVSCVSALSFGTTAKEYAAQQDIWDGTADVSWYDPKNVKSEYTLTTAEQLAGLAKIVDEADAGSKPFYGVTVKLGANMILNEGMFTLAEDKSTPLYNGAAVDESAINVWEPIGISSNAANIAHVYANASFWGNFDGCGYTISGMYVDKVGIQQQGFFATFAGKELKNVNIINSYVRADSRSGSLVGFISGTLSVNKNFYSDHNVLIENIYSDAIVVINHMTNDVRSGGVIGMSRYVAESTFKDITYAGTISTIAVDPNKPARNYGGVIGCVVDDDKTTTIYDNIVMKGAMYSDSIHTDPQTGAILANHCFGNIIMKNATVDIRDTNMTVENGFAAEHKNAQTGKVDLNGIVTSYSALIGCIEKSDTIATYENCKWNHIGVFATGIGEIMEYATVNDLTGSQWKQIGVADIPGAKNHYAASYTPTVPHTCTEHGFISYGYCEYCGVVIDQNRQAVSTVIDPPACTLGPLIKGSPATATTSGTVDHYKCTVCGNLYDVNMNRIFSTEEIPAITEKDPDITLNDPYADTTLPPYTTVIPTTKPPYIMEETERKTFPKDVLRDEPDDGDDDSDESSHSVISIECSEASAFASFFALTLMSTAIIVIKKKH